MALRLAIIGHIIMLIFWLDASPFSDAFVAGISTNLIGLTICGAVLIHRKIKSK